MLSCILSSNQAIEINIAIIKGFIEFKRKFNVFSSLEKKIEQVNEKIDQASETIFQKILQFESKADILSSQIQFPILSFENQSKQNKKFFLDKKINDIIEIILKEVAQYFNIKTQDLKSITRAQTVVFSRQIAINLIRKYTQLPFKYISTIFNKKDHTTMIHAIQKLINQCEIIKKNITNIEKNLLKKIKYL